MPDVYHIPALALTVLLLPAFVFLYRRFRDTRTLLWLLGFLLALARMVQHYKLGGWDYSDAGLHPWVAAGGQTAIQISSALFLASLAPQRFRIGRWSILYVVPFIFPLALFSILFEGVFRGTAPAEPIFFVLPALGLLSTTVGFLWGVRNESMPSWLGGAACGVAGALTLWTCFTAGPGWSLTFAECSTHFVTALLVIFVFRRYSPGVVLAALGFSAWSLTVFETVPWIVAHPQFELGLIRCMVLGKVVAAVGMILLALEAELDANRAGQERERRARLELEAYSHLILSQRRVEDFDLQGNEICQTVATHSRFSTAALLLADSGGRLRLAGSAGMGAATVSALGMLAARLSTASFLAPGSAAPAAEHSQVLRLDLEPWLLPGDDLKHLRFTSVLAVPMAGRGGLEGALLLSTMRNAQGHRAAPLRADDLLPLEMLATRLQATRSQTNLFEKLIDSEKFAGLGQLASNVTQQLNNPLTVILGYASLLEETANLGAQERKGLDSILVEARRMRATLESLSRVSRRQIDRPAAISVTELLADMEQLHRSELLRRSIQFQMNIDPALPRVMCHAQQMRQAVLHCLQFAIQAAGSPEPGARLGQTKSVRLEATAEGNQVQILIAHSGPGFQQPDRAFDPFVTPQVTGDTAGLGLSLCATILRDNNGRASAVNLEPCGAAILLELPVA